MEKEEQIKINEDINNLSSPEKKQRQINPSDFLDKIIGKKKLHTEKVEVNEEKPRIFKKELLRKLSRITNFDFKSEDELFSKVQKIQLKSEELKTEKEKDLEIFEQMGLNCICNKDIFGDTEKLKSKKDHYAEFFNKIIVGNKTWAENKSKSDPNFFETLTSEQKPKYLVISCSDSRVVINEFTATNPGDVFTHRNIGNLVISTDFNCQSVLQYAVDYLKVEHILLIGHTDCGAIKAALSYDHHGLIDHWLKNIREVAEKHGNELIQFGNEDHDKMVKKLIELNIKEQCLNLCKSPIVQGAWDRGQDLYIHGYLFEMETGLLKDLQVVQNDWSNIQEIYKYNFKNLHLN